MTANMRNILLILPQSQDPDVCAGVLKREGPIIAHDLRGMKVGSYTSKIFCTTFFGLCPFPAITPNTVPFPTPKPNTKRPAPSGQTPLQIVHISDTHVDESYTVGASYNCTKPICCRPYTAAEAPGNTDFPAGPFGNTHCDPPVSLQQSMVNAIKSLVPNSAFTIFTGDVVAHDVWLTTDEGVKKDLDATFTELSNLNQVYPAVGNHDTNPTNAFPPKSVAGVSAFSYDTLAADWTRWIGPVGAASVREDGSYSVLAAAGNGKLRIISFNSIFYYVQNYWLYTEPFDSDPSGQFSWLVQQLQGAEATGERVWLIAHVPSGAGDFFHQYSNVFDQIIQRYEATIAAAFYGHTHTDQFEIAYSNYAAQSFSTATLVSYIAPALTPTEGSPGFRVYSVDPVTFAVLDYTQYIADIEAPSFQTGPVWTPYYSAKQAYGSLLTPPLTDPAAELTPAFWHNVTALFDKSDAAFQSYVQRKTRGFKYNAASTCVGACKVKELCELRAARAENNCGTVTPGIHFKKREENGTVVEHTHVEEHACEGSQLRSIFQIMAGDQKAFVENIKKAVERRL